MTEAAQNELRSILTRAAIIEADRQAARDRRDATRLEACERELAALWRRHSELERAAA